MTTKKIAPGVEARSGKLLCLRPTAKTVRFDFARVVRVLNGAGVRKGV